MISFLINTCESFRKIFDTIQNNLIILAGPQKLLLDYPTLNLLLIELRNEVQSQWIPLQLFPLFNLHLESTSSREAETKGDLWRVEQLKQALRN